MRQHWSEMGWNNDTLLTLHGAFISHESLDDELEEYLQKRANEEQEECGDDTD